MSETVLIYDRQKPIRPDDDPVNADWTKQSWDLPFEFGTPEFKEWLKRMGMTLAQFKQLPAYKLTRGEQASANSERGFCLEV